MTAVISAGKLLIHVQHVKVVTVVTDAVQHHD